MIKVAAYGLVRVGLPVLPDASRAFVPFVAVVCAIAVLAGAIAACVRAEWTRLVALLSLSQAGFALMGILALTPDGLTGGVVQLANHGISAAALLIAVGMATERGSNDGIAGSVRPAPSRASAVVLGMLLVASLAFAGAPGFNGFIGTRLVLAGIWPLSRVFAVLAASGILIGAGALLWLTFCTIRASHALRDSPPRRFSMRDLSMVVPLLAVAIWIGLSPAPLLRRLETSVARIVVRVSPEYAPAVADCLTAPIPTPAESGLPAGMVLAAPCADGSNAPAPSPEGPKR
jgi:NADH-quinone oxidoreductase subunit M